MMIKEENVTIFEIALFYDFLWSKKHSRFKKYLCFRDFA